MFRDDIVVGAEVGRSLPDMAEVSQASPMAARAKPTAGHDFWRLVKADPAKTEVGRRLPSSVRVPRASPMAARAEATAGYDSQRSTEADPTKAEVGRRFPSSGNHIPYETLIPMSPTFKMAEACRTWPNQVVAIDPQIPICHFGKVEIGH
ncbi:hypothetical protein DMENIID0001_087360 [Sergentomyia squamirostris]